mgnify:CR=1 FL=1
MKEVWDTTFHQQTNRPPHRLLTLQRLRRIYASKTFEQTSIIERWRRRRTDRQTDKPRMEWSYTFSKVPVAGNMNTTQTFHSQANNSQLSFRMISLTIGQWELIWPPTWNHKCLVQGPHSWKRAIDYPISICSTCYLLYTDCLLIHNMANLMTTPSNLVEGTWKDGMMEE